MVMGELPEEADVVVIGGGPGGYAAAFRAADLGRRVTVISDEPRLGGVCLLRGCIPSKTLLHFVELILGARAAGERGLVFGEPEVDIEKIKQVQDGIIQELAEGLTGLCKARGIERVRGTARFEDAKSLRVAGEDGGDSKLVNFKKAVIASGSSPNSLPGLEFGGPVWDSAAALELDAVPEKLLVVGGGFVGLELGMVYACLGSDVTLIEQEKRLLPETDDDLVEPLAEVLGDLFSEVGTSTKLTAAGIEDGAVQVELSQGNESESRRFDGVLVAVGRSPNTGDLNLEGAGIEVDDRGFIKADEKRQTTGDGNIFAVGDVTGGTLLAHEAIYEGKIAADVIGGRTAAYDARAVPAVVYTAPQIAWCGLTEREAQATDRDVTVQRFPWQASGRAHSVGAQAGLTKLVLDPDSQRVLGVGVVGDGAEHLIAEGVLAVEMGAIAEDLAWTIHAHPTLSETLEEAADLLLGAPIHLPPA